MSRMEQHTRDQIEEAALAISDVCGASDFGPAEEYERAHFVDRWWKEEDALYFHIGCCDQSTRKATIYAVYAARLLCRCDNNAALLLLEMATKELRTVVDGQAANQKLRQASALQRS